jgi:hypothetical protein
MGSNPKHRVCAVKRERVGTGGCVLIGRVVAPSEIKAMHDARHVESRVAGLAEKIIAAQSKGQR